MINCSLPYFRKRKIKFAGLILILALISSGCTHTVSVTSTPTDAEVFALGDKGERGAKLGKTPLTLDKDLSGIEISKPGFTPSLVFIPPSTLPRSASYNATLTTQSKQSFQIAMLGLQSEIFNDGLSEILELQSLISSRKSSEVDALVLRYSNKFEQVSIFHLLMGHHFYFNKDMRKAFISYSRALQLDPKNVEAKDMQALVKRQGNAK